ncbi:MAG: bifunctional shikimate kinase/3-dehydroquinate synthase [Solirubrobacterales bacterium]
MAAVKTPALVFTGFMGAGKSRALRHARAAGLDAADADLELADELGMPVAEFFAAHGEAEFRRREADLVQRVLARGHEAVALGGGAVVSGEVRAALAAHTVVWLRVPVDELWRRAQGSGRPLAADEAEFRRLHDERESVYREVADALMLSADAVPDALDALRALATSLAERLIWAESESGSYPVWIGHRVLSMAPSAAPGRAFCISDAHVSSLYLGEIGLGEAIEIAPGEASKTLAQAERVLEALAAAGATRTDHVVALGGGVVGDLAGFCAATYQRGIPIVQAPTSLLAQVDSAYGGKTGVDLPAAKNYVGAYHQPAAVVTDTGTLATLPAEELASGFVEVIKTALLAGGQAWERVRTAGELDPATLAPLVVDCAATKIQIVASDERDGAGRAVLNLGHTVGHAIEAAGGYAVHRHGEAVGLGLLAALRLSDADELRAEVSELLVAHGLPTSLGPRVDRDEVLNAIRRDKKLTSAKGLGFVLLPSPGRPEFGVAVDPDRVAAAVKELA